jgi:hypothetical protein
MMLQTGQLEQQRKAFLKTTMPRLMDRALGSVQRATAVL